MKFAHGGWVPVAVAGALFVVMTTWRRGRLLLQRHLESRVVPLTEFFATMQAEKPVRVRGTAVFLTGNPKGTPPALLLNLPPQHGRASEGRFCSPSSPSRSPSSTTWIACASSTFRMDSPASSRATVSWKIQMCPSFGPSRHAAPAAGANDVLRGRDIVNVVHRRGMAKWRKRLFAFMVRNDTRANSFFGLPSGSSGRFFGGQVDL